MNKKNAALSVCFVGDSGDGMQLIGEQFTLTALEKGYHVTTLPDFPAEIRAPLGTTAGVSGFKVSIDNKKPIYEIASSAEVVVAMNPAAALKALELATPHSVFILNEDNFSERDFKRAKLETHYFAEQAEKKGLTFLRMNLTKQTQEVLKEFDLSNTQAKKSKNFYALGIVLWLFDFSLENCKAFIEQKFKHNETLLAANLKALTSGFNFSETAEISRIVKLRSSNKETEKGHYINGVKAISKALAVQASLSKTPIFLSGYPITPASSILQEALRLSEFGVKAWQAEDEIAAISAALGASFSGSLAVCCTSGPGMSLKSEGLGLAVMAELPLVVINVQRSGPSTGLPTKIEQSDLNQALFGRHGEAPLVVMAPDSPEDCFYALLEAFSVAVTSMSPVIFLMDALIANGASRWQRPDLEKLSVLSPTFNRFDKPFERDEKLARNWPYPGEPNQIHQLGGLEKGDTTGRVSYDSKDHQEMVKIRASKIDKVELKEPYHHIGRVDGPLVMVSWGGTYGSVRTAYEKLNSEGYRVSMIHLRQLNPFPKGLKEILRAYQQVVVCELNNGQLINLIKAECLIEAKLIGQCDGKPFDSDELTGKLKGFL